MAGSGGGSMVFVASVSGITSAPRHAAYGAAKAGLMSWVRTLAVELGPNGVRANREGNSSRASMAKATVTTATPYLRTALPRGGTFFIHILRADLKAPNQ